MHAWVESNRSRRDGGGEYFFGFVDPDPSLVRVPEGVLDVPNAVNHGVDVEMTVSEDVRGGRPSSGVVVDGVGTVR